MAPLAKQAVEQPWDVWLVPLLQRDGRVQLRERYIQLVDNGSAGYLVVVDRQSGGNVAWTSYPKDNIDKAREGYLLYPR